MVQCIWYVTVGMVNVYGMEKLVWHMVWSWYGTWCGGMGGKGGRRRPAQTNLPSTLVIPKPSSLHLDVYLYYVLYFVFMFYISQQTNRKNIAHYV